MGSGSRSQDFVAARLTIPLISLSLTWSNSVSDALFSELSSEVDLTGTITGEAFAEGADFSSDSLILAILSSK